MKKYIVRYRAERGVQMQLYGHVRATSPAHAIAKAASILARNGYGCVEIIATLCGGIQT